MYQDLRVTIVLSRETELLLRGFLDELCRHRLGSGGGPAVWGRPNLPEAPLFEKIADWEFTPSTKKALHEAGHVFIGELVQMHERELRKIKGVGNSTFGEIRRLLVDRGYGLNMMLSGWVVDRIAALKESESH